jgi:hypothetical protein
VNFETDVPNIEGAVLIKMATKKQGQPLVGCPCFTSGT